MYVMCDQLNLISMKTSALRKNEEKKNGVEMV